MRPISLVPSGSPTRSSTSSPDTGSATCSPRADPHSGAAAVRLSARGSGTARPDGLPLRDEQDGPILVAWSDNGSEMKAIDTRQFMALMAIAQHHGRPGTPTDQAHIESSSATSRATGRTSPASPIRPRSTPSSPGSVTSTTTSACTPRSATSPQMTSITAAGPPSAVLAPLGCVARGRSESSRIEPAKHDQAP